MSEAEAIKRGLIPDPKLQRTTAPPDPGPVFDRERYKAEQSIPKLPSTPKPLPAPIPMPVPVRAGVQAGVQAGMAFPLVMVAIVAWLIGFICGLRMGQ